MATTSNETMGTTGDRPRAMDSLSDTVDQARERVADTTGRAANMARDKMDRLAETASETAERVGSAASEYVDRFSDTGERLLEDARDYIGAHPLRTLGMAAAAGFLIGRMLR